jgi:diguanylate cyclase
MIEFLCTIAGMIAGGAIVASIIGLKEQHVQDELMCQLDSINVDKIRGITTQLQSLSEKVLDNVCSHTTQIKSFGEELSGGENIDTETILLAVDKIISANQKMQSDLEDAQKQLAEQKEIIETTTIQAKSDALTGLANRRALEEHLGSLLGHDELSCQVGLLLMDIDHFKRFNDTYGHLTGDAVLTCFARNIVQSAGDSCFAARYGGEEFVVVLQAENRKALVERAAFIRQFVSQQSITHEDLELSITASAGLVIVQPGDNLAIAYERSDEGLYMAKEQGRNQGRWLDGSDWKPFPNLDEVANNQNIDDSAFVQDTESQPESTVTDFDSADRPEKSLKAISASSPADALGSPKNAPAMQDLASFVDAVRTQVQQLHQMELPAATIMVEATMPGSGEEAQLAWQKVVVLLQTKMRGMDIACYFRPATICFFLPGCSAEASYERAFDMKRLLIQAAATGDLPAKPKRVSVAVGHMLDKEEISMMLNRMESALNEAHGTSESEIAIHDGQSTQFLQV